MTMQTIMKLSIYLTGLVFLSFSGATIASSKSDLAKEKRWEEQIVPSLLVGEDVKLKAAGVEFLALYAEPSTDKVHGGLLILHGIGVHPAWPDVIDPIRMAFPDKGWHTLSLQMPILKNEAEDKDYPPLFDEVPGRIQAGVDYLKSKGIKNIVIVGHSLGVTMSNLYLAKKPDSSVKAIISAASGPGYPKDKRMDSLANFKKIKIPFVDIYGTLDSDRVKNAVKARTKIAKQIKKKDYTLVKVEGANHFYAGKQEELIQIIDDWLNKNMNK
jgi:pimeloyl-ACP methyl ester carboxylesterase